MKIYNISICLAIIPLNINTNENTVSKNGLRKFGVRILCIYLVLDERFI